MLYPTLKRFVSKTFISKAILNLWNKMLEVKVSKKFQVVIPKEVRKNVNLSAGDQLMVRVEDGSIIMIPKPKNYTQHMLGLHKKIWKAVKVERYIEEERESWEEQ